MVSRLNGVEVKRMRELLIIKYLAEFCQLCHRTPEMVGETHLQLHETRYVRPLDVDNFIFLCRSCNKRKELSRTNIEKASEISASQKTAQIGYPLFLRWLEGEINKPENNNHLPYDLIISQAAYDIGMTIQKYPLSVTTIKRQLEPLCDHPTSPFVTRNDNFGQMQIWLRGHEPKEDPGQSSLFGF